MTAVIGHQKRFLPRLHNYKQYAPTNNCYLDGQYFNRVFGSYPGLIKEPLVITFDEERNFIVDESQQLQYNSDYTGLLRVIIEVPHARHCDLVLIEKKPVKKSGCGCKANTVASSPGYQAYLFDPLPSSYTSQIAEIVSSFLGIEVFEIPETAPLVVSNNCQESGFCNAFVIKYAYDYLNKQNVDFDQIKSFCSCLEDRYVINESCPDKCYGFLDNPQVLGTGLGALGGAATGALLTGGSPAGVLLGGIGGGALGYGLSGGFR